MPKPMVNRKSMSNPSWYFRKGKSVYKMLKYQGLAIKALQEVVNVEVKQLTTEGTINPSTSGTIVHLSALTQNDTQSGREGNSVKTKFLGLRATSKNNASATSGIQTRVILFRDKQQVSDTSPSVSDVLSSDGDITNAFLNPATVGRFQILWDKTIYTSADGAREQHHFKLNLTPKQHIRFNGTASSDIQKGGLYMLVASDQPTNTPTFVYTVNLKYFDN